MTEPQVLPGAAIPSDEVIERMWHFAERIANAKFIAPTIRGDIPSVFYLISTGQEMGLSWTHALRGLYLSSDGQLGMQSNVMLALLQSNGFDVKFTPTENPAGYTCTITRPGGDPVSRTFTMDDAKRIRIYLDPQTHEWRTLADTLRYQNYGTTHCQWRSLAHTGRVAASDLIGGIYLPEELIEVTEQKESGASAAVIPANGKPAAAAEEFVVGEKPEPSAETADNISPECKPAAAVEPETKPAEQPASQEKQTETPAAAAAVTKPAAKETRYSIRVVTKGEGDSWVKTPIDGPLQTDKDAAALMARAKANDTKLPHIVVEVIDGVDGDEVVVCNPPTAATPTPAQPAAAPAADNPTFDALLAKAIAAIGGDQKAAGKLITLYLAGFLGVDVRGLPKDKVKLTPPMEKLAEVLDKRADDLKVSPEALGKELAGRAKSALDQTFDQLNWPLEVRELARKVMAQAGQNETNFAAWIQHPMVGDNVSMSSLPVETLPDFLNLFLLVRGRAWEVVDLSVARQQDLGSILRQLVEASGVPVREWTADFAIKVLDTLARVTKEEAEAPAPKNAPPPAPDEDSDFLSGGLPFGD